MSVALIAPPWPLFNRPSIQLGALKAWLTKRLPGLGVVSHHPYLDLACALGYMEYHRISQSSWAAEAVSAPLLFPERRDAARKLFENSLRRKGKGIRASFDQVVETTRSILDQFTNELPVDRLGLVGFSLCLNQMTAGLYMARKIKERRPDLPVVLGGASVSGPLGESLLENFPWIDFVVDGEGELPLEGLVRLLAGKTTELPAGLLARDPAGSGIIRGSRGKSQIQDLEQLPVPDFDDYFKQLQTLSQPPSLSITLPMETSRGCWWNRCRFCNLNLQWEGYRYKSPETVARQVRHMSGRYQVLDLAMMDNCLPPRTAASIFDALAEEGTDLKIFCELRAVHDRREFASFAKGGLRHLQVGIEALSDGLLRRLRKGATVMDNLAALRHAAEFGIEVGANLILGFPGSTEEEAEETLMALDFVWPFAPLKPVEFWLGHGSPAHQYHKELGIHSMRPAKGYLALFPKGIANSLKPLILDYRCDRTRQRRIWSKVRKKAEALAMARRRYRETSLLTWREGGSFITINQRLPDGTSLNHRLSGISRQIYLSCQDVTEVDRIAESFPQVPKEKLLDFFADLMSKKLLFHRNGKVLALATRDRSCGLRAPD